MSDYIQIAFYIVSPIATFLAVSIAYLAIYRQSKPNIIAYYEPGDSGSVIDLVIGNYGAGTARNINFSRPIPISCWGIEKADKIEEANFFKEEIPVLAPNKELRYQAGQYGGLSSIIKSGYNLEADYQYRTPLKNKKMGSDTLILNVKHLGQMHSVNDVKVVLSDALQGRNSTIFKEVNKSLNAINSTLRNISKNLETSNGRDENGA